MPNETNPSSTQAQQANKVPSFAWSTVSNAGSAGVSGKTQQKETIPMYSMTRWQNASDDPYYAGKPKESFEEKLRRLEALARSVPGGQ